MTEPQSTRVENNQGRACDAVVRFLETLSGEERTGIAYPELSGELGPVDLIFSLGGGQYALEHTLVEPFEDQIRFEAHFSQLLAPVTEELAHNMPKPGVYELIFPIDTRLNVEQNQLGSYHDTLIQWVRETALELYAANPTRIGRDICPRGIREQVRGRPDRFPFDVTLVRSVHWSDSGVHDGKLMPARYTPEDVEAHREERIQRAVEKKKGKLTFRKNEGYTTLLALENNDIALTNHALVGEKIVQLLPAQPEWLDELFFIDTTTTMWTLWRWNWSDGWWIEEWEEFDSNSLVDLAGG